MGDAVGHLSLRDKIFLFIHKNKHQRLRSTAIGIIWNSCVRELATIASLTEGKDCWNGWLSPKRRLSGTSDTLRISPDSEKMATPPIIVDVDDTPDAKSKPRKKRTKRARSRKHKKTETKKIETKKTETKKSSHRKHHRREKKEKPLENNA